MVFRLETHSDSIVRYKKVEKFNLINACCIIVSIPDTDECASALCQNGATCTDSVDAYSCSCAAGYKGVNCEISKYQLKYQFKWEIWG